MPEARVPANVPEADEFEISVFGGGYGECVCIHFGEGSWAIIDSFVNPVTNAPVALDYLDSLGLDPNDSVRLVIASHWDDDHIQGISKIAKECSKAKVVISGALSRRDVRNFVATRSKAKSSFGSGLSEMVGLIQTAQSEGRLVWASANKVLWTKGLVTTSPVFVALSPSEDTIGRSIEWLVGEATSKRVPLSLRYRAPDKPNGVSVVGFVNALGQQALFGADLENTPNPEGGWDAVVSHSNPGIKASAFKIPHHGSKTSHNEGVWMELIEDDPLSIVSPWTNGGTTLPSNDNLDYLLGKSGELFLTAPPLTRKATITPDIDRLIRRMHGDEVRELVGMGHVRARRNSSDRRWLVDSFGDAAEIR